jgi:hypothetical protein
MHWPNLANGGGHHDSSVRGQLACEAAQQSRKVVDITDHGHRDDGVESVKLRKLIELMEDMAGVVAPCGLNRLRIGIDADKGARFHQVAKAAGTAAEIEHASVKQWCDRPQSNGRK